MSTALQPFAFEGAAVRAGQDEDGSPWFVATDIARILGHRDAEKMTRSLDADERGTRLVSTPGGDQNVTVITESGLYSAILTRQTGRIEDEEIRETVARFKRWVTHTVLPSIRKTGGYGVASSPAVPTEIGPAFLRQIAEAMEAKDQQIAALEPRAEVADRLLTADGDLSVADTAKALTRAGVKVGAGRLFNLLSTMRWIYRAQGDGRWRVYQAAIDGGWMSVLPASHYHPKTGVLVLDPPQPRVTPKGLQRLLREHGADVATSVAIVGELESAAVTR